MKSNLKYEKIQAGGALVYRYQDPSNEDIKGQVICIETKLHSELKSTIDLLKRYLDMVFTLAHGEPDIFDADSSQLIVHQLLDGQERKIDNIFEIIREKMGELMIVENPSESKHIDKNQIVDVYIDETRGR